MISQPTTKKVSDMEKQSAVPISDTVKARVLHTLLLGIRRDARGNGIEEIYARPGDVIELPRKQAEQLAGRAFEGYLTSGTENGGRVCAPKPPLGGQIKDPIVQIIGE
jgi:hypothetical protein